MRKDKADINAGFTLLEVLIAITVSGLMIAVFANAFMQIGRSQHLLDERMTARVIGNGKMAEMLYGSEPGLSGEFAAPYQNFRWNAAEESLADGSTRIDLTVEWRDGLANPHQTRFVGYRCPQ
jgi:prepilin-type N-terminal cleavage/methylation domain